MTSGRGGEFGFAAAHDAPIPYLQRIRDYYLALGYGAPYEWAHYAEVPFHALAKPLSGSRIAIVTTAAPYQPDKGDQGPGAPYNAAAKFYTVYSGDTAQDKLAVARGQTCPRSGPAGSVNSSRCQNGSVDSSASRW